MEAYLGSFERSDRAFAGNGKGWLRPLRQEAFGRFVDLGFPTNRDEDWKFTNVFPIAQTPFNPAQEGQANVAPADLEPFHFPGLATTRLVFVNGKYSPELSTLRALPGGVKIANIAQALTRERALLEPYLGKYVDISKEAFSALNTAFLEDGAFVHIPRGAVLREPVHLLYVAVPNGAPTVVHPRNLILIEDEGQGTVIEDHVSLWSGVYFSNGVTEIVAGQNSVASYYQIERQDRQAFHVSTLRVEQARQSSTALHSVLLGGGLVRSNIHPVLTGEGSDCLINGLFMGTGRQHLDNFMKVEHIGPHGTSRQAFNGILDEKSRGVFHGRIIVHPNAQKTDSKQTNRNLLLSADALIDTKPQLEIHADDVKCTHGATIGQFDEESIFYLRSRGIAEKEARALLLYAFAGERLLMMKVEPVRKHLEALVNRWIPQTKPMEVAP